MRKTDQRIMIYQVDFRTRVPSKPIFVHPIFAVLLTLFDGEKQFDQVLQDFFYLTNKEYNDQNVQWAKDQLAKIAKGVKVEQLLVEKETIPDGISRVAYQPMDFVIAADQVKVDAKNFRIDFPLYLTFNVTTQCQMNCKYCYHPRDKMQEYISLNRLEVLFAECAEKGCETILLTGGDPFAHPDIISIMKMIKKNGLEYSISTKSYLNLEICQRLKEEAELETMQISLDAADPKVAAFLTGMDEGFFQRAVETIQNLHAVGVVVTVRCVLTSYNADQIEDLLTLCHKLEVEFLDISAYDRTLWRHSDDLVATEEQLLQAAEKINQFAVSHTLPAIMVQNLKPVIITHTGESENIFQDRGVCSTGRLSLTLLPNGEVTICEQLKYDPEIILGDLRVQSIQEVWNSEEVLKWLSPPPREIFTEDMPCRSCSEQDYAKCHQHYSRCYKNTFDYFNTCNAPDLRCHLAPVQGYRMY